MIGLIIKDFLDLGSEKRWVYHGGRRGGSLLLPNREFIKDMENGSLKSGSGIRLETPILKPINLS
jgi:hypothetical protein